MKYEKLTLFDHIFFLIWRLSIVREQMNFLLIGQGKKYLFIHDDNKFKINILKISVNFKILLEHGFLKKKIFL